MLMQTPLYKLEKVLDLWVTWYRKGIGMALLKLQLTENLVMRSYVFDVTNPENI